MRTLLAAAAFALFAWPAVAACYVPAAVGPVPQQQSNQEAVMLCQSQELKAMADSQVQELQLEQQIRQQQILLEEQLQLQQQQQLAALNPALTP